MFKKVILLVFTLLFLLLLARDPFSSRNLIPNLEPFPDTFYYLVPAKNLAEEGHFGVGRGYGYLKSAVPPLYSIALAPAFLFTTDVRAYYFINVLLSLISLYIFYRIVDKISSNVFVLGFALLLYSTNYYIYWYPQWAMAENLLLPVFLLAIYLLLIKPSAKSAFAIALATAALYMTKYAAAPISLILSLLYPTKIFLETKKMKLIIVFAVILAILMIPFVLLANGSGKSHLESFINIILKIIPNAISTSPTIQNTEWIGSNFFRENLPRYIMATLGQRERFLWEFVPILPSYISILGYTGLALGLTIKKLRLISFSLFIVLASQILLLSTFYAVDMRYLYVAIPILIIGCCLFFRSLINKFNFIGSAFIVLLGLFYFFSNFPRIKSQIGLNFRHSEVPWYYKSVDVLNKHFESLNEQDIVLVSPLPPYLIDFYSTKKYKILPLSDAQDFRSDMETTWGPEDYSDLTEVYKKYIRGGKSVFLSTYGVGNSGGLNYAVSQIKENFRLEEVLNECYSQCKLYRLYEK